MFSKELEELIDAAFADGVLTDKERTVILNKAEAEGINLNEVEMVLDAKVHNNRKQKKLNIILALVFLTPLLLFSFYFFLEDYDWSQKSIKVNGYNSYQDAVKDRDFESAHMILSNILNNYHNKEISNNTKYRRKDEEIKEELLRTYKEGVDYVFNSEALYLCSLGDKTSLDRIVYLLSEYPIFGVPISEGTTYRTGGVLYDQVMNHKKYINSVSKVNGLCDKLIDLAITNHNMELAERVIPQYKNVPDPVIGNYGNMHTMQYSYLAKENAIKKINKAIDDGVFPNITEHIK